jgi:hypothetical protein
MHLASACWGGSALDFPLIDLLDEQVFYDFLVDALHPNGLTCPACGGRHLTIHRAHRDPVLDYRCACGCVFNAWTGLRNFLRPFRGVSKWFLDEYVGIFQWIPPTKVVTADFIRVLFGLRLTTKSGP